MKPLLAHTVENYEAIKFPVYGSPKLDGYRALITPQGVMSRAMKLIPNKFIQQELNHESNFGLDGELIIGEPNTLNTFNNSSGVMKITGEPDFRFYVFDTFNKSDLPWVERRPMFAADFKSRLIQLEQIRLDNLEELLEYERRCLENNFEGIMIRDPQALYKHGRSTEKQGILGKVKRFSDSEAVIIGRFEEMENQNAATTNELGRTTRSTAQEGLVGKGTLGGFLVRDIHSGVEFSLGGGFTAYQRQELWKEDHTGKIVVYKYFKYGVVDKPRFPVFKGFRDAIDVVKGE